MRQPDPPPFWPRDDAVQAQVLARRFEALLKSGDSATVLAAIRDWPPADILSCLMRMRPKRARTLFALLPEATGLPVLAQLDPELRQVLWDAASPHGFASWCINWIPTARLRCWSRCPTTWPGI